MHRPRWNTTQPIVLDGRTLEGGGQLIRNALCLSALTGIPVEIHDIRGNRSSGGGLKAQHLACVKWLAHACSARTKGAELKSKTLLFEPGQTNEGVSWTDHSPAFKKVMRYGEPVYECRLDIGTAGSTGLALQAILLFILFSEPPSSIPIRLTLTGGTNVSGSPSYEYISQVLLPTLRTIGCCEIEATLDKRGWSHGPNSIGSFTLVVQPRNQVVLPAIRLKPDEGENTTQRQPTNLHATFIAPQSCHGHFCKVLRPAIEHNFGDSFSEENGNLQITCENSGHEKRIYFILVATISTKPTAANIEQPNQSYKLARDWLYDRKIRSHERAATEMAEYVTNALASEVESGAFVDLHMRDQLIIFQALANGTSEVFPGVDEEGQLLEPSLHARTAEFVAKRMLGARFDTDGKTEGAGFGVVEDRDTDSMEDSVEQRFQDLSI